MFEVVITASARDDLRSLKKADQNVMKAIDLSASSPTLTEVLELAGEDNVILRTAEGREYVLVEIDDFAEEIAAVVQNKELMKLLDGRSKEKTTYSLSEVREQLQGRQRGKKRQKAKQS